MSRELVRTVLLPIAVFVLLLADFAIGFITFRNTRLVLMPFVLSLGTLYLIGDEWWQSRDRIGLFKGMLKASAICGAAQFMVTLVVLAIDFGPLTGFAVVVGLVGGVIPVSAAGAVSLCNPQLDPFPKSKTAL